MTDDSSKNAISSWFKHVQQAREARDEIEHELGNHPSVASVELGKDPEREFAGGNFGMKVIIRTHDRERFPSLPGQFEQIKIDVRETQDTVFDIE